MLRCEARDEGRSLDYDAEERNEADGHFLVQTRRGRGFPGDLLCRAPCEGGRPFAAARFAHLIPESRRRGPEGFFNSLLGLSRPNLGSQGRSVNVNICPRA